MHFLCKLIQLAQANFQGGAHFQDELVGGILTYASAAAPIMHPVPIDTGGKLDMRHQVRIKQQAVLAVTNA